MVLKLDPKIKEQLERAGYRVYNHSAVEICHWTKKAIRGEGTCYKNVFYGIDTHRCMQITQAVAWCPNRCIYCWRPNEEFEPEVRMLPKDQVDPPEVTLEKLKELRKQLLIGFKGNPKVDQKLLEEALEPSHVTFSLAGEPLLYPFVPESIKYIRENWKDIRSIFVVTSGQVPEELERMRDNPDMAPTQLYISFTAPNKELYEKVSRPMYPDFWERFLKSLEIGSQMRTRRVARITLIKGINDDLQYFEEWAELIQKFNPHFVEVKAFMLLGYSRYRLSMENMPRHEEIVEWAKKLVEYLPGYEYWNEHPPSRIAVLKNRNPGMDIDPIIRSPYPNV